MAQIRIETAGQISKLFIDGKDVSHICKSYTLEHSACGMPTLTVTFTGTTFNVAGDSEFVVCEPTCEMCGKHRQAGDTL